ncbi:MAG: TPM domain-containing protein, partial [Deltaproteobacteria bacterium]|nr:TPM domain-containing protein [Deltaproteobacteria bacterium]
DSEQERRIVDLNRRLLEKLDIHFMTIILDTPAPDLDAKAIALFDRHALGKKTKGARGMLFLVDPRGKAVRLETGYDLEGMFTDAFTGYVEREQMRPFFAAGKIGPGIEATVELLVAKALQAIKTGEFVVDQENTVQGEHLSGGAGARTGIQIGDQIPPKTRSSHADNFAPQPTPLQTLERYMQALRQHIKDPDLGIYSPETRDFFRQWVVTNAQQDNELKGLENVLGKAQPRVRDQLAVIRFPVEDRGASPYFLELGEKGWMLDFHSMNQLVRFNHKNQWHFIKTDHRFAFAFTDLRFDKHGFPHRTR